MGGTVARRLVLLVVALAAAGFPGVARAGDGDTVVMFSDPGDYIGGGLARLFRAPGAAVTTQLMYGGVDVQVSGGPSGDYFDLTFAAPPGQALAPGVYVDAQRTPFRTAGHPGIDIYGSGRGCNEDAGRFEVKDIGMGADGKVNRLWLVYEPHS